jgi:voltage-gated potassium channel
MAGKPSKTRDARARALRRLSRQLLIRAALVFLVLIVCPLLFWQVEHDVNPEMQDVSSAFSWIARTLFERGSPYAIETPSGRVVYSVVEIAGLTFVALFTGAIASRLVSIVIEKGKGMGATKQRGHVLICGWSTKGAEIIRELRSTEVEDTRPIVVLARLDSDPTRDDSVEFLRGDPSDEVDLRRAGIEYVDTAIILADDSNPSSSDGDRDARTLLTCLAVESINPDCYSCAEVIRSENRQHFSRTRVNELVVSAELTGALLASAATTHGVTQLVTDLLTHPVGHEFYRMVPPQEIVGMTVGDALGPLKRSHDATLVAMLSEGVRYDINPAVDRVIRAGDALLVIAAQPIDS